MHDIIDKTSKIVQKESPSEDPSRIINVVIERISSLDHFWVEFSLKTFFLQGYSELGHDIWATWKINVPNGIFCFEKFEE